MEFQLIDRNSGYRKLVLRRRIEIFHLVVVAAVDVVDVRLLVGDLRQALRDGRRSRAG